MSGGLKQAVEAFELANRGIDSNGRLIEAARVESAQGCLGGHRFQPGGPFCDRPDERRVRGIGG